MLLVQIPLVGKERGNPERDRERGGRRERVKKK